MSAVDRKYDEFRFAHAPQPQRAFRRNSRPRKRRGIGDRDANRFADLKIGDFADRNPFARRFAKNRRDDKSDERNAEDSSA